MLIIPTFTQILDLAQFINESILINDDKVLIGFHVASYYNKKKGLNLFLI